GASQRVVDAHFLESDGVGVRNRLASPRVEKRAGGRLIGDETVGGIDHEAIVAKRVQDRGGLRRRLGGQFADRFLALGKLVDEKLRQRVVESVGARGGGEEQAGEQG